jgi:hypothetical protein
MKGTGLKVNEVKEFLQSSYEVDAPKNLFGYVLDEDLSNLYGKVYVNEEKKRSCLILSWNWYGKFRV